MDLQNFIYSTIYPLYSLLFFCNPNTTNACALIRSTIQQDTRKGQLWDNFKKILYTVHHIGIPLRTRWCIKKALYSFVQSQRGARTSSQTTAQLQPSTFYHSPMLLPPSTAASRRSARGARCCQRDAAYQHFCHVFHLYSHLAWMLNGAF